MVRCRELGGDLIGLGLGFRYDAPVKSPASDYLGAQ
jgi:hypothetical protein